MSIDKSSEATAKAALIKVKREEQVSWTTIVNDVGSFLFLKF